MSRPRYSVYVGRQSYDKSPSELAYFFRDHSDGETDASGALTYGTKMLYRDGGFVTMKDPHDAIIFCRALNAAEEEKQP